MKTKRNQNLLTDTSVIHASSISEGPKVTVWETVSSNINLWHISFKRALHIVHRPLLIMAACVCMSFLFGTHALFLALVSVFLAAGSWILRLCKLPSFPSRKSEQWEVWAYPKCLFLNWNYVDLDMKREHHKHVQPIPSLSPCTNIGTLYTKNCFPIQRINQRASSVPCHSFSWSV